MHNEYTKVICLLPHLCYSCHFLIEPAKLIKSTLDLRVFFFIFISLLCFIISKSLSPVISTNSFTTLASNNSLFQNQQPLVITRNVAVQLSIKLSSMNFISWKAQFNSLLLGHKLLAYINGTTPLPLEMVLDVGSDAPIFISNPAHEHWIQQDQLLLHGIISSATETIVPFFFFLLYLS